MKTLHRDFCPLCASTRLTPRLTCTDHYASGEQFTLTQCEGCGLLFTQDAPTEQDMPHYYLPAHTNQPGGPNPEKDSLLIKALRKRGLNYKADIVEKLSERTRGDLLDICARAGLFPQTMQQRGWNVHACEPDIVYRQYALHHYGLEMLSPTHLMQGGAGLYDVITLWQAIEHEPQISLYWDLAARLLRTDGRLIIAVPNCASADAAHYQENWAAYDVPRHLWHFTPHSMLRMAEAHGFRQVEVRTMAMDAFPVSVHSEQNRGYRHSYLGRGIWHGFRSYMQSLVNKERSSTLIYAFRKK